MQDIQKKIYRKMPMEKKLMISEQLYWTAWEMREAGPGLKRQHSDWDDTKINEKLKELFLYAKS